MVQWQTWRVCTYVYLDRPASSWGSEDAVMQLASIHIWNCPCNSTQDCDPDLIFLPFCKISPVFKTWDLMLKVCSIKKTKKKGCLGRSFCCASCVHMKVGTGSLSSICKSVSPSHPHSCIPMHAKRFLFFISGRFLWFWWFCSVDLSLG